MKFEDVSVGVTAFLRPEKLGRCLSRISGSKHDFEEIVVAGNGPEDCANREVAERHGAEFLDLQFDCGVPKARNRIVEQVDTEYLLLLDDDVGLPKRVNRLKAVLDQDKEVAGVSGQIQENGETYCHAQELEIQGRTLARKTGRLEQRRVTSLAQGSIEYYLFDFVPLPGLYRTKVLEENGWDESYRIGLDHVDFFLQHKDCGHRFAVVPNVVFDHWPGGNSEFISHRESDAKEQQSWQHFTEKWGVLRISELSQFRTKDEGSFSRTGKTAAKKILPNKLVGELQRRRVLA